MPIRPFSALFGTLFAWLIALLLVALYGFSLFALLENRQGESELPWSEIGQILTYSSGQALLSAVLTTFFGVLLARAFFYLNFRGKNRLYQLISFAWALPALVVIFAVIGIWGNAGWLAQLFQLFGGSLPYSLYGLTGIILAHLLLNIPLMTKYSLEALHRIPASQFRLAAQLHLTGSQLFKMVELPALKNSLPYAFGNVFLICFTSFPIVLMLGGSPKYSTLEVAIYQAVSFEFDFSKAVKLIFVQLFIGLFLQMLLHFSTHRWLAQRTSTRVEPWIPSPTGWNRLSLFIPLIGLSLFILTPLASVVYAGLSVSNLSQRLQNPELWRSVGDSLFISLIAATSVIFTACLLAFEARRRLLQRQTALYSLLNALSNAPLVLPVFLLAVGLFLLFRDIDLSNTQLLWLVGICNGLTLLPFIYQILFPAMWQSLTAHHNLARSLNLNGIRGWWIVERPYLIRPLLNALILALSSSLGSFAVLAFFGNPDFSALPYLLYQQLGSYRTEDAAVTALVLMLMTLLPFLCLDHKELR